MIFFSPWFFYMDLVFSQIFKYKPTSLQKTDLDCFLRFLWKPAIFRQFFNAWVRTKIQKPFSHRKSVVIGFHWKPWKSKKLIGFWYKIQISNFLNENWLTSRVDRSVSQDRNGFLLPKTITVKATSTTTFSLKQNKFLLMEKREGFFSYLEFLEQWLLVLQRYLWIYQSIQ
jgi:hypothetical protein